MADFLAQFPKVNFFRFYPENNALIPTIFQPPMDLKPQSESQMYWQVNPPYYHRAMFDDVITIMIHTQANDTAPTVTSPPICKLFKVGGTTAIATVNALGTQNLVNDIYTDPVSGATTPMQVTCWVDQWSNLLTAATDSGIYYFKITNYDTAGTSTEIYLSDPIMVYDGYYSQVNTALIEANYNTNTKDVIIENWTLFSQPHNPVFYHRLEAHIRKYEPQGYDYSYLTQNYNQLTQDSNAWRGWELHVGHKQGIPDTALEAVTYALQADTVVINGMYYAKKANGSIGALWRKEDSVTSPLIKANCIILDKYNSNSIVQKGNVVTILELPETSGVIDFPLAFNFLAIRSFFGTVNTAAACIYDDEATLRAYLLSLNTGFNHIYGLRGTWNISGTKITYRNAIGEHWVAGSGMFVLGEEMNFNVRTNTGAGSTVNKFYVLQATGGTGFRSIVGRGDGTIQVFDNATAIGDHTYPSQSTTYNLRIFHTGASTDADKAIGYLWYGRYSDEGCSLTKINVGSKAPATLENFIVQKRGALGLGTGGSVDTTFFDPCVASLLTLSIDDITITNFTQDVFQVGTTWNYTLTDIYLHCHMNTSEVNDVINNFAANVNYTGSGVVRSFYIGQNPTAAPTGAALTFLNTTLPPAGAGWTVYHD